jgi:hypothetical protein
VWSLVFFYSFFFYLKKKATEIDLGSWHLIPPLIYSEARVRPFSDLYFLMKLITVRYFCHFILNNIYFSYFSYPIHRNWQSEFRSVCTYRSIYTFYRIKLNLWCIITPVTYIVHSNDLIKQLENMKLFLVIGCPTSFVLRTLL